MGANLSDLIILVFGHQRPSALGYVLEGLRRQDALRFTQVWLDGHQEHPELVRKVLQCQQLELWFPDAEWVKYGSHRSLCMVLITALERAVERYSRIVVLEDDCFPAQRAVATMGEALDAIESDPCVFSVYGHHFNDEREGETTTAFQCWGWGTTAEKLRPVLRQLKQLWHMDEPDCVRWINERMTPQIRQRMDVFPGRSCSDILRKRFCWDAAVAFLVARAGMVNQRTSQQVVYNFGIGRDSGHFSTFEDRFLRPPFNMIREEQLVNSFNLSADRHDETAPHNGGPQSSNPQALTDLTSVAFTNTVADKITLWTDYTIGISPSSIHHRSAGGSHRFDCGGMTNVARITYGGLIEKSRSEDGATFAPTLFTENTINCTNSSAMTVTLPGNATQAIPVDTEFRFLRLGAGEVTFVADQGATVHSRSGHSRIGGRYGAVRVRKIATDEWLVYGNLK